MRKVALPLILVVTAVLLMACSSPADQPAHEWARFLDKHAERVEQGRFDADDFKAEGEPIVAKLRLHVDHGKHELLLSKHTLAEWKTANTNFQKAFKEAGNQQAKQAYKELADALMKPSEE